MIRFGFRPTYRPTAGPVTVGAQPHPAGNSLLPNNKSALPPTYNPYVVEKKNQVLDQIAKQKKATKEAKGRTTMETFYGRANNSLENGVLTCLLLAGGPNSIEILLEFWLEKSLEFWLEIPHTKNNFKNG